MPILDPLPYVAKLDARSVDEIRLLVIHCTELPDLATAREYGERPIYASGTGNSGHYYIDRDGRTVEYVPIERVAHHTRGHNPHSIGVELVNRGRYPDWFDSRCQQMTEAYTPAQIDALLTLIATLKARCPALAAIAGHEDLDRTLVPASDDPAIEVRRKRDPGTLFPWDRILAAGGLQRLA